MTGDIPTQVGDALILQTEQSFTVYAVGRVARDGQQDFAGQADIQYFDVAPTAQPGLADQLMRQAAVVLIEQISQVEALTTERDALRSALEAISRHDDWVAVLGSQPSPQAIARAALAASALP